jgi:hypothetical protein
MFPPEKDELDRRPVWDALQTFWMDSDANLDLTRVAELCANSKYSLADVEEIYWNEVRPAVRFNLVSLAGEWAGFDIDWLAQRIIDGHCYGKRLPRKYLHPHSSLWWHRLSSEIKRVETKSL